MNELEQVRQARRDDRPSDSVKSRDREMLRDAIMDATLIEPESRTETPGGRENLVLLHGPRATKRSASRRTRRRVAAAAAALVVVVVAAGVLSITVRDPANEVRSSAPVSTESTMGSTYTCGGGLPLEPSVPAGFAGPFSGPASRATTTPTAGQLVLRWESPAGALEYRWPADPDGPQSGVIGTAEGEVSYVGASVAAVEQGPQGASQRVLYSFDGVPDECQTVQLTAYGSDVAQTTGLAMQMARAPFTSNEPLVTHSTSADEAPELGHCTSPIGEQLPNHGITAPIAGSFATPRDALNAFVTQTPTVAARGYTEFRLSDGSYAYGAKGPGLDFYVTLVHVVGEGGRWQVASWRGTGC